MTLQPGDSEDAANEMVTLAAGGDSGGSQPWTPVLGPLNSSERSSQDDDVSASWGTRNVGGSVDEVVRC